MIKKIIAKNNNLDLIVKFILDKFFRFAIMKLINLTAGQKLRFNGMYDRSFLFYGKNNCFYRWQ